MTKRDVPSIECIREWLIYDQSNGQLIWRKRPNKVVAAGQPAGYEDAHGYIVLSFFSTPLKAHRLVWALVKGEWPHGFIDHINGGRRDNRIQNLRVVDSASNAQNRLRPKGGSKLGVQGVVQQGDRYRTVINTKGRRIHLGVFDSIEEARFCYLQAKRALHPAFSG